MFIIIKKKIISILILGGIILFCSFIIITKIVNNIPTRNNIAGAIGLITLIPLFIGIFLYARKLKQTKPGLARFLLFASTTFIIMFSLVGIIMLIKSI
jgi:hypothetical protein